MAYAVKETYYTLQGEGAQMGRAAVFCRFSGCNLWSGLEQDRGSAACRFCDTDFRGTDGPGGGRFDGAKSLAQHVRDQWPGNGGRPYVVFTGGEPALQLDEALVNECHALGLEVGIETNGTRPLPDGIDWVCVSPKPRSELLIRRGHELKLVFPQPELEPDAFERLDFQHHFLQPMDSAEREVNTGLAVAYCRAHPRWRLSLQTHKLLGIP